MNKDQLECMRRSGMYIGSHGHNHYWLVSLSREDQENEIDMSMKFLKSIGAPTKDWAMCYPYGAYNESLIRILKKKKCKIGFTTKVNTATLSKENAFTLERIDTNDLPPKRNQPNPFISGLHQK